MYKSFTHQLSEELSNILTFWQDNTIDLKQGGFVGRIDHFNTLISENTKGIILNTRILWTFARANNFYKDSRYNNECLRAFEYLHQFFRDTKNGGVFWEVDHLGNPTNTRKQVYAQAFCIYALAEYYKYSKNVEALSWALELFDLLETKTFDRKSQAYIEAFNEQWMPIEDLRLSEKDLNAPITTNTHLHILEAYTVLHDITKGDNIKTSLIRLQNMFTDKIFNNNNHLELFFSMDWKSISNEISFGHDIETVWLLVLSAQSINDPEIISNAEKLLLNVTNTFTSEALDNDYGVWNSKDAITGQYDYDKHWWPQAEAMVGLVYAWNLTNDDNYLNLSFKIWEFIKNHIIDTENGEWFFRVNKEGTPYSTENKVGPWKCPYHNSRALMEVISMLEKKN